MAQKDSNSPQKRPTSQMNLLLRCVIGAYLVYLAFSMRSNFDQIAFILFAVIFGVAGVVLVITSIKRIFQGDYDLLDAQGNILEPDDLDDLDDDTETVTEPEDAPSNEPPEGREDSHSETENR